MCWSANNDAHLPWYKSSYITDQNLTPFLESTNTEPIHKYNFQTEYFLITKTKHQVKIKRRIIINLILI